MTTENTTDWTRPQEVSDVEAAFPARIGHLMPPREECEAGLRALTDQGRKWIDFQQCWFFDGLPANVKVHLREGVDGNAAFRHLGAIQGSFEPKHEHKEAAVAYLASLWFTDVEDYKR